MSALLTKAFEKWVAECTASNLPARPDAIIFALMEREPTREDNTVPEEKITYAVNELTYGQLSPNNIVCSAVVPDDCAFSYDWICLIHQASGTLCGVIKTPVQQKATGESLIRNFTIIYSGIAQAAQITVPPQSWQVDLFPEINKKAPLNSPAFIGTPTTPTPPDDAVGLEMANAAFVRKLLAALVDSSPETLDTLNELAAALGNDPNFATTITNALAGKQPLNDVLTAVSQITPEENTLPYFSTEGRIILAQLSEKARSLMAMDTPEAMRTALELKAAATMAPQSDIYDRTEGRLALPGGMGFGALFSNNQKKHFSPANGPDEFLQWVRDTPPGRYLVSQSGGVGHRPIINATGTVVFVGYLDIELRDSATAESHKNKTKQATFKGVNGEIYIITINDLITAYNLPNSWTKWLLNEGDFTWLLRSTTGNDWGSPGVGGLIFAAYFGESDADSSRKMKRGQVVSGSRLGTVTISAKCSTSGPYASTPQFITVSPNSYPQAGSFIALSGSHLTTLGTSECFVGLFMRVN
ncbi:TPA: hypothetical protein JZG06_003123 [Escherichia coli]|nr:hypothetical protein [Escherichia coli]